MKTSKAYNLVFSVPEFRLVTDVLEFLIDSNEESPLNGAALRHLRDSIDGMGLVGITGAAVRLLIEALNFTEVFADVHVCDDLTEAEAAAMCERSRKMCKELLALLGDDTSDAPTVGGAF